MPFDFHLVEASLEASLEASPEASLDASLEASLDASLDARFSLLTDVPKLRRNDASLPRTHMIFPPHRNPAQSNSRHPPLVTRQVFLCVCCFCLFLVFCVFVFLYIYVHSFRKLLHHTGAPRPFMGLGGDALGACRCSARATRPPTSAPATALQATSVFSERVHLPINPLPITPPRAITPAQSPPSTNHPQSSPSPPPAPPQVLIQSHMQAAPFFCVLQAPPFPSELLRKYRRRVRTCHSRVGEPKRTVG